MLNDIEKAGPAKWSAYQDDLVRRAVERAAKTATFQARLAEAGTRAEDVRSVADLARVGVLSKDDLPALQAASPPFGGMLAVPFERLRRVYTSPGPILDPEGDGPDFWRFEAALRAAGFTADDVVYNTFSYHLTPAGAMMEEGLRALGCTVAPGGVGNTETQLDFLARIGATAYTGTPDFLHTLVTRAAAEDVKLSPSGDQGGKTLSFPPLNPPKGTLSLRRAFVSGGPLPPALRRDLEDQHGLDVYQGYGTADAGAIGYECAEKDAWHVAPGAVVEIVDPATGRPVASGESGEVVVTVPNDVYPLVRFGTGDLSALSDDACACGRTTPRLLGWQGRVGDGVKVRGMFVHAQQLVVAMADFPAVGRYQAVVRHDAEHKDRLTVRVAGEGLDAGALIAALRGALKVRPEVEIVEEIAEDAGVLVDERTWD